VDRGELFRGERVPVEGQAQLVPHIHQCFGEFADEPVVVMGRGRDPQPLETLGDGRIVDRLDVDCVLFKQEVARSLAEFRIADEHRHNMRLVRHDRQAGRGQHRLGAAGAVLMALASPVDVLRWRIAAVAAAHTAGGSAVVKMKPGAKERNASISEAEPAI
jgi:hypothetical protein